MSAMQADRWWVVCVFYSSHSEQGTALSAREAQQQLQNLLAECDPGYAYGVSIEMHEGDIFPASKAPEDRKGYFTLGDEGELKLVDQNAIYSLGHSVYNIRGRTETF